MIVEMKTLVETLNKYRDSYYNKQVSIISDHEYDMLYDKLERMESETGIVLSNSPTRTVGFEVKSELEKVKHSHAMLSLSKTKSIDDLAKFVNGKECIITPKLDGLTILLTYEDGELIQAETRGNGEEGEIVTHNAKVFANVPMTIPYKERFEIEGEAIITYDDFKSINEVEGGKYKNPRNLVSGSVRQLDSKIARNRNIRFIAWKVPTEIEESYNNSFCKKLYYAYTLGFDVAPIAICEEGFVGTNILSNRINSMKDSAKEMGYPIDGMVITYDDVKYGESLGYTGHHPKHSIAYKFYDEEAETTLKHIEWTMGKTEVLTPVAVFEPVEIDGTIVERASVHNVSILKELDLCEGDTITVYKANQIIPQISDNLSKNHRESTLTIPDVCPICGFRTIETRNNNSTVLRCINPSCKGQLLGKLTHFCSRNAMNIEGLSESTLEKFIELNYINSFEDIYNLDDFYYDIIEQDGFGKKSVDKLMSAIENSKKTTLDRFLYALSIPNVGRTASKIISKRFDNSFEKFYNETILKSFNFETLEGFGSELHHSINGYLVGYEEDIVRIAKYLVFENEKNDSGFTADLTGKIFAITGSLDCFENRDKLKEVIESLGGKVSGSVSKKTNYLVNNDVDSASSKNKKAKELGVEIITEKTLLNMLEQ